MGYTRLFSTKWWLIIPLLAILLTAVACGDDATPVPQVIEKEVIKEVPVTVVSEVVKEVPVTVVSIPKETKADDATAKVERLRFATNAPWMETMLPWMGGSWGSNLVTRVHMEPLIEIQYNTGAFVPGLATSWTQDKPDATQWTFNLREDVPFHFDMGDFSAQDVRHTVFYNVEDGAISTDAPTQRSLFGKTKTDLEQTIQFIDDHTIQFNLLVPDPDFEEQANSEHGQMVISSKRAWDELGKEGNVRQPAGTGTYRVKKYTPGFGILWERVEWKHWKTTPNFAEFEMVLVSEPATRLAMLLGGEAGMVEIPRELNASARAAGMKTQESSGPALQVFAIMGGNYLQTTEAYDPTIAMANVKVREAINRAIDRDTIHNNLFKGIGVKQYVFAFHPDKYGWDDRYEREFESNYGYDPEKAKQLLIEAGYPNGFPVKMLTFSLAGLPEAVSISEAMDVALRAIGIQSEIEEGEYARLRTIYFTARKLHDTIHVRKTSFTNTLLPLRWYNIAPPDGAVFGFEDTFIQTRWEAALKAPTREERDRLTREIGNWKFDQYAEIPFFWIPAQVVIDPKVVGEYVWPGIIDAAYDHFEYITQGTG